MKLNLIECLEYMVKYKASDLHLKVNSSPLVRKNRSLFRLYKKSFNLTNEDIQKAIEPLLKAYQKEQLEKWKQVDFSRGIKNIGRFRFNIFYQRETLRVVARSIPFVIPDYDTLNLPQTVRQIVKNSGQKGLILVTGATGAGKSSTIIAMLEEINRKHNKHIITIEDPIEFLLQDKKSLISQRELGVDYVDYNSALKSTLRQDPDIIFFGELRDLESMETALTASNTGHLVLSTLHTNNVSDTINRILGMVSPGKKKMFRMQFAASLRAIICQQLVMTKDESKLIPAVEVLINNPRIREMLESEDKSSSSIYSVIEESKDVWGMQSFNQHLIELVDKNLISEKTAMKHSPSPEKLNFHFKGLSHQNARNKENTGKDAQQVEKEQHLVSAKEFMKNLAKSS